MLSLPIRLWMSHRGEVESDALLAVVLGKGAFREVRPVISNDTVRDAVSKDDLLEESSRSRTVNFFDGLSFNPLSKLVDLSRCVSRPFALLKGPTMLIPHTANNQVIGMVFNAVAHMCGCRAYFWRPTQVRTISSASACAESQKKPCRKALATSEREGA